ncbi:ATP-binding protein [Isoptericola haloaureus]|uniref:histidine kinase n=1 Tax=Isoptericola haloaureus TaxID=1542902 RepID=A0ABU7Z3L5_9MICO
MEDARGAATRAQDRFVRWCWVAGTMLVVLVAVLAGPVDAGLREQVARSAIAAAGVLAALSCGSRAVRSTGRRRRAWGALALGAVVGLLGNLWAAVAGDPATGDVAYIGALALGAVGLAFFPTVRPRGQDLVRMLLDSIVVGGSVLYIAVFAVVLDEPALSTDPALTTYALPVVDALLATLAVLVMTRSGAAERVPLVLVGSGFVLYAVADVAFALLSAGTGFTFGSIVDMGWIGGYVAIAVAARHPAASGSPVTHRRSDGSPVLGTVVTFLLFLAAALVRVSDSGQDVPWMADVLWVAVLVAVVARQILVVVDNESLRRSLERRVRTRTAQLRALAGERERTLESVADGIYGVDAFGRLTFVNVAGARTLGVSPGDLVGQDVHATFHAPGPDGAPFPAEHCYVTEAVRDGITTTAEQDVYRRPDGKDVPVEVTASPLRADGAVRGAVVVFRDVTERREMERIKDDFVAVVSHELRTPLTSIRGALGLLDSGLLADSPERAGRMIRIALTSSERLSRLVDDILDIERMATGSTPLDLAEHRVDDLVATAVDQVAIVADEAGVDVVTVESGEIVSADGDLIVQTLTNLLSNAVKFSPPGSTVRVTAVPVGDLVEVCVEDEGRGIPPDKLESIFRRFEQIDASDARERGGTGLGLAIARSVVERHGGRIWAVSDGPGTGASLRFTLRRAAAGVDGADGSPPQEVGTAVGADDGPDDAPPTAAPDRVVVAATDPYVVRALRSVLEGAGYDVVGSADGEEAVAHVIADRPAALVLDPGTRDSDGIEVLRRVREARTAAETPVVAVSGTARHDAQIGELADRWLVEPVAPDDLLEAVREAVRRRPHREQVLVVEGDDALRHALATSLEGAGLVVTPAGSLDAARRAMRAGTRPDLVLLDLTLPDVTGRDLVADLLDPAAGRSAEPTVPPAPRPPRT